MCVDYTSLNKACPKDLFSLQRIDQVVNLTAGCEPLSFLNAYSGYHQIHLTEVDQLATTFITPFGYFCYVKMLFGLKNAGTTYQRCMQFCFKGHNLEVYVDDIVVISQKSSSVISDLEETFNNLRWFNIKLNLEKCTFKVPRASSWDTSSLSTKSKQPLTRSRPLLTWVRSGTLRTFSDSLGASQPSAVSCPSWGNVGSTCISYSRV
jgi:hypothetical protein